MDRTKSTRRRMGWHGSTETARRAHLRPAGINASGRIARKSRAIVLRGVAELPGRSVRGRHSQFKKSKRGPDKDAKGKSKQQTRNWGMLLTTTPPGRFHSHRSKCTRPHWGHLEKSQSPQKYSLWLWRSCHPGCCRHQTASKERSYMACAQEDCCRFTVFRLLWSDQNGQNWFYIHNFNLIYVTTWHGHESPRRLCCLPGSAAVVNRQLRRQAAHKIWVSCKNSGSRPKNACKQRQTQQSAAWAWHHEMRHFACTTLSFSLPHKSSSSHPPHKLAYTYPKGNGRTSCQYMPAHDARAHADTGLCGCATGTNTVQTSYDTYVHAINKCGYLI